jgi:hypothetical protein
VDLEFDTGEGRLRQSLDRCAGVRFELDYSPVIGRSALGRGAAGTVCRPDSDNRTVSKTSELRDAVNDRPTGSSSRTRTEEGDVMVASPRS